MGCIAYADGNVLSLLDCDKCRCDLLMTHSGPITHGCESAGVYLLVQQQGKPTTSNRVSGKYLEA